MAQDNSSSNFLPVILVIVALVILGGAVFVLSKQKNKASTLPTHTQPATSDPSPTVKTISLDITSPQDKSITTSSSISVSGKTVPRAEVNVNDQSITADKAGVFSTTYALDEGDNIIDVVANDQNGNSSEKELAITYTPITN